MKLILLGMFMSHHLQKTTGS